MRTIASILFSILIASAISCSHADIAPLPDVPAPENPVAQCQYKTGFPGASVPLAGMERGASGYFPVKKWNSYPDADSFHNRWYGGNLVAMNEPSLLDIRDRDVAIYRFLWLRSFHLPISVRIERKKDRMTLFTKELISNVGRGPGTLDREYSRNLDDTEWCALQKAFEKVDFWNMPFEEDYSGVDGAMWILEGVRNERYHIAERWSPQSGHYREACILMLELSGIDTANLGITLY